jgi:hypothetical protein
MKFINSYFELWEKKYIVVYIYTCLSQTKQDQYRVWTCVAAKHSSNVSIFYTCFKCLGMLRSSVERTKWLNYNYIFHMDKINMYINTVQSLNTINWTLFEFQITHTTCRYRPCDRVIKNITSSTCKQSKKTFVKTVHNRRCMSSVCLKTLCKVWIILIEHLQF